MTQSLLKILRWIPYVLFLFLLVITVVLYSWLESHNKAHLYNITSTTSEQVSLRTEAWIDARMQALNQLAEFVPPKPLGSEEVYKRAATELYKNYSGLLAINWINADYTIDIVVPYEDNAAALGKSLKNHSSPSVYPSALKAQNTGQPCRTSKINLFQGGAGFATYIPIYTPDSEFLGFINAVFRVDKLLNTCLNEDQLRNRFNFAFFSADGDLLYNHNFADEVNIEAGLTSHSINVVDKNWTLIVSPSDVFLSEGQHDGSVIVLAAGIIIALLLSTSLRSFIKFQENIRRNESQYRLLFEDSRDPIYITSRDGSILAANPAMSELFGYTPAEFMKLKSMTLFYKSDEREQLIQELIENESIKDYEVTLKHKSGKALICLISAAIRENLNNRITFQGNIRDITERVELEEKMNQSQKMEAIGRLAGGIAHDFNNLLTVISGNVEILDMSLNRDSELRILTGEVDKTVRKATDLIKRLLTFSRKDVVKPEIIDLNALIQDAEFMLRRLIHENIDKFFNITDEVLYIRADRVQIEQIIVNLSVNARDAMNNGGELHFDVKGVDLDSNSLTLHNDIIPGRYAQLTIRDTGMGIPPEDQPHIFEPFFTTKGSSKGTGLGLATVYGIIQRLRGIITFTSRENEGTTFDIYLPTVEAPALLEVSTDMDNVELAGSENILVIEDNDSVRSTAVRVLNGYGYKVEEASGSSDAEHLIKSGQKKYDLILSDVIMPGKTGPELIADLKHNLSGTKVLFMSGYTEDLVSSDGIIDQKVHLLSKPFHPSELAKRIRLLLDE